MFTHASLCQSTASPDLDGFVGDFVCGAGGAHLEETDRSGKMLGLLLVRHVAHLVCDCLEP